MTNKQLGFTLVEMSIVLVIIALLAAGIVIGQVMIREAQLRAVLGEYDRYAKAIQEFQDKYQALPGDMNTATNLWGSLHNCAAASPTTAPTTTATCNGNGDGMIAGTIWMTGAGCRTWYPTEAFSAWQHLSNAGLIDGQYTGLSAVGANVIPGINVPASKLSSAAWGISFWISLTTSEVAWGDNYGHVLVLSSPLQSGSHCDPYIGSPVLTPAEALAMDKKIDDGMPGTGKFRVVRNGYSNLNCTNETTQTGSTYNINDTNQDCNPFFLLGM